MSARSYEHEHSAVHSLTHPHTGKIGKNEKWEMKKLVSAVLLFSLPPYFFFDELCSKRDLHTSEEKESESIELCLQC